MLAKYGYADTAYKLLLQDTAPSWLYEVKQGATTVWETWTGIDANGHPSESLNHYSYGAICGWLFGGVCGVHLAGETLTIAPTPNPALGWAKAVYDSPVGRIESGWQYEGDTVQYTITVPCNLEAQVILPDGRKPDTRSRAPTPCNAKRFPAKHNAPHRKEKPVRGVAFMRVMKKKMMRKWQIRIFAQGILH